MSSDSESLWVRRLLRDAVVWVRCRPDGTPLVDGSGRVDVRYKPTAGTKLYRARADNLSVGPAVAGAKPEALPEPAAADEAPAKAAASTSARKPNGGGGGGGGPVPPDAIIVYTDGACTGNPGPMGIGVVVLADGQRAEVSEYLGRGTNNIAELTAIGRGLEEVAKLGAAAARRPVLVHSDSSYAIGLLSQGWKAKANVELVASLRALAAKFPQLRFVKVAGHAGVPENERCDELARNAVTRGR